MTLEADTSARRTGWRPWLQDHGDEFIDRFLGIDTAGSVSNSELGISPDVGSHYRTSNWLNLINLARALSRMNISNRDVFIDFGCGKGQVLALAARYPFARIIGLDLSEALLATAARNMDHIRRRTRCTTIELVHANALDYEIPDDVTVCYFYMPFPTSVYEAVVSRLAQSLARRPRSARIIYLNQGPDDAEVPARHGFHEIKHIRRMAVYSNRPDTAHHQMARAPRAGVWPRGLGRRAASLRRRTAVTRRDLGKRLLDVSVASSALVLLSPLFLAIAIAVRVRLGRPIVFRQQRPGLHGRPFTIYKFRTMRDATDAAGKPIDDADRTPPFGHWLRSVSLDELPELWNVVRGDMSLVGPRPLLMRYLDRYTPEQMRRHEARPGITGLAQVGGRNALTWDQKFALDLQYVDHHDLRMDLSIIARTIEVVFAREGIHHPGDATMPEFMGSTMPPSETDEPA